MPSIHKNKPDPVSILILMGVSGCGKTVIGINLAGVLDWEFVESDNYHSHEDVRKMSNNIPLTDADRWPWLKSLHDLLVEKQSQGIPVVLACSALKESYREMLREGLKRCEFVYLQGDYHLIWERMRQREHFMKPTMLQSQFDALEEPQDAFTVHIDQPVDRIIEQIIHHFNLGV